MSDTLNKQFCADFGPDSQFGGTDFRPHFDGYLYNASRLCSKSDTREIFQSKAWSYVREVATWIIAHKSCFQEGDRFQIIIGWPESVRSTGRQIIKEAGGLDDLSRMINSPSFQVYEGDRGYPVFRSGWDLNIYTS